MAAADDGDVFEYDFCSRGYRGIVESLQDDGRSIVSVVGTLTIICNGSHTGECVYADGIRVAAPESIITECFQKRACFVERLRLFYKLLQKKQVDLLFRLVAENQLYAAGCAAYAAWKQRTHIAVYDDAALFHGCLEEPDAASSGPCVTVWRRWIDRHSGVSIYNFAACAHAARQALETPSLDGTRKGLPPELVSQILLYLS